MATWGKTRATVSHGELYTPKGWAESIAIKSGVIVAVGDEAAVGPFKGAGTKVLDLNGAAVVPDVTEKIRRLQIPRGMSYRPVLIYSGELSQGLLENEFFAAKLDLGSLLVG